MKVPGFIGPTYQSQSLNVDAERCLNLYPEFTQPGNAKAPVVLYSTPGLRVFNDDMGNLPIRGAFYENGRMFVVAGPTVYELQSDGLSISRGTVDNDNQPVTIDSNGIQIYIVSAGEGYILTLATNVFAAIADPDYPANVAMGGFLDGYFFALVRNTKTFYISALFDGTSWDLLDVASKQRTSDNILTLVINHQEVWLMGEQDTEVWYNNGDADFPFTPVQGVLLEVGIAAQWSFARMTNTLVWIGSERAGPGICYRAEGYAPQRISTHAIETAWRRYNTIADAEAWMYVSEGHQFYVVSFPAANATWVWDGATNLWHERCFFNTNSGQEEAILPRNHLAAFGVHLVGSRREGVVYQLSNQFLDDAGFKILRMRRSAHTSDEQMRLFYDYFQLDLETGTGGPSECNPIIMLRWSDDGGHTYSKEYLSCAGAQGQFKWRAIWRRLGHSRDRVWEISMTENTYWAVIDAYVGVKKGIS